MALKRLTENDLREDDFLDTYSNFISFDEENRTLQLKNLELRSTDSQKQLVSRVRSAFSPNVEVEVLIFENVKFEANNLNLSIAEKLVLKSCAVSGNQRFGQYPKELEIIDCNISKFNFELDARSLLISGSNVGTITINSYQDGGPRVKTINVQGNSRIYRINGLHWLLENDSSTVIIFSQDSKIASNAEASYRIMRLISNKFGDVVQSHIFHTNSVELYARHADKDTKALLFFEKWTNNFGRSIFLPLFWMLLINLVFLSFISTFSDKLLVSGCADFISSVANVSPLSSFVSEEISKTSWEFSADSVRRVILAVLTYQIIVAARRFSFVKK